MSDYAADELGIERHSADDHPWTGVPATLAQAVVDARTADEVIDALVDVPASIQKRLLHPQSGSAAMLLPVRPGVRVLAVSPRYGVLTSALVYLGGSVTHVDWSYARLRFAQLMHEPRPGRTIHLAPGTTPDFDDHSFDVLCVDLDELMLVTRTEQACNEMLQSLSRLLTPDGVMAVFVRNARRPRTGAGLLTSPWRRPLLSAAGLTDLRAFVFVPASGGSHTLVPESDSRRAMTKALPASRLRGRVKASVKAEAARFGAAQWVAPEYVVLGHTSSQGPPLGLVDDLESFTDGCCTPVETLSDARVLLRTPTLIVKFPLHAQAEDSLVHEVRKTSEVRRTALGRFVVPTAEARTHHGTRYAVFPRIAHRAPKDPREGEAVLSEILSVQSADSMTSMRDLALWRRLDSARGRADVVEMGAQALLSHVYALGGELEVPSGVTHGDLHMGNVLMLPSGDAVLIDWNRSELHNPLVLDAVYAAVRHHQRATRSTLAASCESIADGRVEGPLADQADRVMGPLTPVDAVVLMLLDRVASYSRPRRRYKPWTVPELSTAVVTTTRRLQSEGSGVIHGHAASEVD